MNKYEQSYNELSAFQGQEAWRFDLGYQDAKHSVNINTTPDPQTTGAYQKGFKACMADRKQEMMRKLLMGEYSENESKNIKRQILP